MLKYFAIFITFTLIACNTSDSKSGSPSLDYNISTTQSQSMLVKAKLTGSAHPQRLNLQCDLENLAAKELTVKEVIISTSEGLRSFPKNLNRLPISIKSGAKAKISFDFYPINNLKLYQYTEMNGILKSKYRIEIVYKLVGSNQLMAMDLPATLPLNKFNSYKKTCEIPLKMYHLKPSNTFSGNLRHHLKQQKGADTKIFVHLSDRELAVAGLNFSFKTYKISDSLITKIAVVNHSQFPIKIDTSKLDFFINDQPCTEGYKKIVLQKITGYKNEYNLLRKGDRMIINLSRVSTPMNQGKITLNLKHSWVFPTGKSLFCEDLEIVEMRNELGSYVQNKPLLGEPVSFLMSFNAINSFLLF